MRLTVSETPVRAGTRVDWPGAAMLGVALAGLLLAISEGNTWHWGSARVVEIFAASASAAAAASGIFVVRELTAEEPLIDPRALSSRPIASANVAVFAVGFALLVGYTLVPLFGGLPKSTGYGLGLSTIQLSLALAPSALGSVLGGMMSGRAVSASGARLGAALGALCGFVAYAVLIGISRKVLAVAPLMLPVGFGVGLAIAAVTDLTVLAASREQTGVLVGLNSVVRAVGSALGAQIAVAIWTAAPKTAPGVPARSGITNSFVMALVATALAGAATLVIPRRSTDPTVQTGKAAAAVGLRADVTSLPGPVTQISRTAP